MRIALLSDIHGNLPALEAVVADAGRRGVDQIVNLGDSLSGPLLPLETAEYLMARDWLTLAGNHERQLLHAPTGGRGASDAYAYAQLTPKVLAWLATLSHTSQLLPEVLLCHGSPRDDAEYLLETVDAGQVRIASARELEQRLGAVDAQVIACGHTHVPRVLRDVRGRLLMNPGSVGLPAYQSDLPEPHEVETGAPDARYAILERGAADGNWTASLVSVPYDHAQMAELARSRGRLDWAQALQTGRMA